MMSEANFLKGLMEMDVDGITPAQVTTIHFVKFKNIFWTLIYLWIRFFLLKISHIHK